MPAMASLEPFTTLTSVAVPVDIVNCDTDQIIPARFLHKANNDPDYHSFLFHDLRFNADGSKKDFPFNADAYNSAEILVADINWGCGSSRENAVTALAANGIRTVIAPSIADIHYSNCIQNGVLPVCLTVDDCNALRRQLHELPGAKIAVDLNAQSVTGPDQTTYTFEIDDYDKYRLLNGLDEIGLTQEYADKISGFAKAYRRKHPWAG